MAIESATDRAYLFDTDDFGVSATFTSPALGSVDGIFDEETVEVSLGGDIGVLAPRPVFTCATSAITGVTGGSALTVSGTNYKVKNRLNDGTGVTTLELENA